MILKEWILYAIKILYKYNKNIYEYENILTHIMKLSKKNILESDNKKLNILDIKNLNNLLLKIIIGIPINYIIKEKEFWSMKFKIDFDIFIPRNETELLIEFILNSINNKTKYNILDLGTGSGSIAISLSNEIKNSIITGSDISLKSLNISNYNYKKLSKNNNINFIYSNWFKNINDIYDIIISNPPYISVYEFNNPKYKILFDPKYSIISSINSIYEIKHIIKKSKKYLKKNGLLILEHGFMQGNIIKNIFKKYNFLNINTFNDYNNLERFTVGFLK